MSVLYAGVWMLDVPYYLDRMFDYYVPEALRDEVTEGCFVTVPFGGGNRRQMAAVFRLSETCELESEKIKPILGTVSGAMTLTAEQRGLCLFLKDHTFCTVGEAIRAALPAAGLDKLIEVWQTADGVTGPPADLTEEERLVWSTVTRRGGADRAALTRAFGSWPEAPLAALVRRGLLKRTMTLRESSNLKYTEYYSLSESYRSTRPALRGAKQQAVAAYLDEHGSASADELKQAVSASAAGLRAMAERGLLTVERCDQYRDPYRTRQTAPPDENILSEEQAAARDALTALYRTGEARAALLHGVTGSGKTRVIKAMIDEVLADGRSVIVLVPEISLTPQTVGLFLSYYGERIAVVHSSLSSGERLDAWRRMKNGEADICIGTRSAIFAPFDNLGMIVIDEEQEHTYKSDMDPKYHARDVARYRCGRQKALMLLASATPSLESYYKAKSGVYTLVEMKERYGGAVLPKTVVADMRLDAGEGKVAPIGTVLGEELRRRLKAPESGAKEQSILFINRRGYNNFLSCVMCGGVIMCPHCSVSLTYHSRGDRENEHNGILMCHYCGYRIPTPRLCPSCGSEHIRYVGFGTQKVEQDLCEQFEGVRVSRMDADTTAAKFSYESILASFRQGGADILLGTQMVAKGHDFPAVTLVGVVNADSAFYLDDYRAGERTFSLLTQVIGRAGRGDRPGLAVIQTYNPEFPVLKLACAQDYAGFYENEIAMRRALVFPPFCDMMVLTLTSEAEHELQAAAAAMKKRLDELLADEYADVKTVIFGPMEAPLYRLNEKYRLRFVIKCRMNGRTRLMFRQLLCETGKKLNGKINLTADVNPNAV